jgi:formylmethanofuran dehydrogenase subunit A
MTGTMRLKLKGGTVVDPAHGVRGEVRDVFVENGRIVTDPGAAAKGHQDIDVTGMIVMAGAIDLHTHIGGGKVNIARAMLPEDHRGDLVDRTALTRSGCGHAAPSTLTTGYRYAEMGYTACFEPAMLPINARQAHMEMGDTPIVDKGAYAMLGSDDFLLRMLAANDDQQSINDYVAWTITHAQAMGLKVVNPGGISAFKFNQRMLDLDEAHAYYRVTPRRILKVLAQAVHDIGVPHPLHVHGCNLGVPGNVDTTLATMDAVEGLPMHLTHIQFHSYGTEGDRKFSSGAARIAEAINARPNISADVGQILFGQTVTASGDNMAQFRNAGAGSPKKSVVMDIECDAGCGVVPFKYRDKNFVNALQWAIGLEIFLLVDDPWRIFLTTDHPNGAPFTTYPHLIRLLMDKTFRNEKLAGLNDDAQKLSNLGVIDREYSLYEIAIMTRAAPARTLGLVDRGHLAPGAAADITVYRPDPNPEVMFAKPAYVFKDGELVARDGAIVKVTWGNTHVVKPPYDAAIERPLASYFERFHTMRMSNFKIGDDEMCECGHGSKLLRHTCRLPSTR